jgi:broad specificity phosphatase PhoE
MKKIYLIRHGQTDYNFHGIVQGSGVDTSLNETGRGQAEAFYQAYKHMPFKKIYTSSLKRSIESVEKFIGSGIPWEKHPGLNEISWGDKDGKIVNSDDNNYYQKMLDEWKKGNVDMKIDGGESPVDVEKRIKPVMEIILSRPEEDLILICMHGRAMRILLASFLHQNLHCMDDFHHQNLCLYVLNYSSQKFEIEKFNETGHLKSDENHPKHP